MAIPELNTTIMEAARERLSSLAKPVDSLGLLETFAVRLAGIRGRIGGSLKHRVVLVFAADNGVYRQHLTSVPQSATSSSAAMIASGVSGGAVLAKAAGASIEVYNVGCVRPVPNSDVRGQPVMLGTEDITLGPAMDEGHMKEALRAGAAAVDSHRRADVLGIGETGICNTTTAAAVTSCILGLDPRLTVGPGAGITGVEYDRKLDAVAQALEANQPDATSPLDVIAKVGGLDIAAMTGAYLRAARLQIPTVIDGFISACAALCAVRLQPDVRNVLFASHCSTEPGFAHILSALELHAPLNLEMRLGEGSGCPIMFQILEDALTVISDMGTWDEPANIAAAQAAAEYDAADTNGFPNLRIDS